MQAFALHLRDGTPDHIRDHFREKNPKNRRKKPYWWQAHCRARQPSSAQAEGKASAQGWMKPDGKSMTIIDTLWSSGLVLHQNVNGRRDCAGESALPQVINTCPEEVSQHLGGDHY